MEIPMKKIMLFLAVAYCAFMLNGCAVYKASVDERPIKTIYNDEVITANIMAAYLKDDAKKILDISPASYEGHVYLVGEYATDYQKQRAIELARKTDGVRSVTYYLLPKKAGSSCGTTDNIEIQAKVDAKLIADDRIWSTNVDVKAVQCNVVLLGIVGTQQEISRSVAHARSVPGVRSVRSYLRVK
jgi:hyperosmotically inducible protein